MSYYHWVILDRCVWKLMLICKFYMVHLLCMQSSHALCVHFSFFRLRHWIKTPEMSSWTPALEGQQGLWEGGDKGAGASCWIALRWCESIFNESKLSLASLFSRNAATGVALMPCKRRRSVHAVLLSPPSSRPPMLIRPLGRVMKVCQD